VSRDFTLDKYRELCQAIIGSGYGLVTVRGYLENRDLPSKVVILRHDVDRKPGNALRMAELERELGLSATYYFRKRRHTFKPKIIRSIARMGHEIGYHYEALVTAGGNCEKAIQIFEDELNEFREICDVATISMHGSPLWKHDNRDLWQRYDFREFGIIGEAYLSIDYDRVAYLSDTGRTWDSRKYNIRDIVAGGNAPQIDTTDDLISLFESKEIGQLCILVHPNRWPRSKLDWMKGFVSDALINHAKIGVDFITTWRKNFGKSRAVKEGK